MGKVFRAWANDLRAKKRSSIAFTIDSQKTDVFSDDSGAALILDHYGLIGYPQQDISLGRVAGVVLILAGVLMIRKF